MSGHLVMIEKAILNRVEFLICNQWSLAHGWLDANQNSLTELR